MKPFRRSLAAALVALAAADAAAMAQTPVVTTEADLTAGYSSDEAVTAAAAQLRLFGEAPARVRFNIEGTWAARSDDDSDAFGAAYPYSGRIQLSEAYAERLFARGATTAGIRLGQYRSPFGISSRSDHAYSGFLRAPLVRYDGYWSITNSFLERGADVVAVAPHVTLEASLGTPGDIGLAKRRSGLDAVVRVQGHYRSLVVGVSRIASQPYMPAIWAKGRLKFTGVDARWTLGGIQLRGEWIDGQPWNGPSTNGWYVDAIVHRRFMGPVTAVLRSEQLTYTSPTPFPWYGELRDEWLGRRHTAGARVRLPAGVTAQIDVIRQSGELAEYGARTALDIGLTYSVRRH